jgi:tRNA (guanine-N7-)-methyltransferase
VSREAIAFWAGVFGNDLPVNIEIGPGHGDFLVHSGRQHPHENFLAIERAARNVRRVEAGIERHQLTNVVVVRADAACLITLVPDASVSQFYVLFPDPWWKRRHHRRRLLTPAFVAELRRTLLPGGLLHFATDVRDYFMLGRTFLDAAGGLEPVNAPTFSAVTRFACKAQARGEPLYSGLYRRR